MRLSEVSRNSRIVYLKENYQKCFNLLLKYVLKLNYKFHIFIKIIYYIVNNYIHFNTIINWRFKNSYRLYKIYIRTFIIKEFNILIQIWQILQINNFFNLFERSFLFVWNPCFKKHQNIVSFSLKKEWPKDFLSTFKLIYFLNMSKKINNHTK